MGILHWQRTHNSNGGSELSEHTATKAAYTPDMGVSCCEYCRLCTRSFDQDIHKLFSLLTCSLLEIRDHSSLHTARAMLTKKTLWRMFFESVVSDFWRFALTNALGNFCIPKWSASALSNAPTRNFNFSKSIKFETVERPHKKVEKKAVSLFSFRIKATPCTTSTGAELFQEEEQDRGVPLGSRPRTCFGCNWDSFERAESKSFFCAWNSSSIFATPRTTCT